MSVWIRSCDTISISCHQFWIFDNDLHHRVLKKFNRSLVWFSFWCSKSESQTPKTEYHYKNHSEFSRAWFFKSVCSSFKILKNHKNTDSWASRFWVERLASQKKITKSFPWKTYRKLFSSELCFSESESNPSSYPFTKKLVSNQPLHAPFFTGRYLSALI